MHLRGAWVIAAVLHLAIGSGSVAAITAAGTIGPVLGSIDVAPIVIGLAVVSLPMVMAVALVA